MSNELTIRQEMNPQSWQMLVSIAETSATSITERQKIAKHLLFCFENQLPLSLAVNGGLYTVKDRVEVEGTVIRAQIRKHPHYDYRIDRLDNRGCTMTILSHDPRLSGIVDNSDWHELGSVTFDESDAKQAGLSNKEGVWQKYPADMYLNRATSRAYKRFCPDIFFQSVYVRGELSDEQPVIITQETIKSLTDKYGHDKVLDAASNCGGDIDAMIEYLKFNYGDGNE